MRFFYIFLILPIAAYSADDTGATESAGKTAICSACHGAEGLADNKFYPNLAGQNAPYIEKQLRAFQSGERNDPIMSPMAKNLNDADIQALAAHYSKLR